MLKQNILQELLKQVNNERYNSACYYEAYNYFEEKNLEGFSKWCFNGGLEEQNHFNAFLKYINEQNMRAKLSDVKTPILNESSEISVIESILKLEKDTTERMRYLSELAYTENDFGTAIFLQDWVNEQIKSEHEIEILLSNMKRSKDIGLGLLYIDTQLLEV